MSKKNQEIEKSGVLHQMIIHETKHRGKTRIQYDFEFCPSMTDVSGAKETDLNYLIERFKPDELAAYMAARNQMRPEIHGHDFTHEPLMQEGLNKVYEINKMFDELPDEIRLHFRTPLDFLRFIDNPQNTDKMLKLGILKKVDIEKINSTLNEQPNAPTQQTTTTTQEAKESSKS